MKKWEIGFLMIGLPILALLLVLLVAIATQEFGAWGTVGALAVVAWGAAAAWFIGSED